MTGRRGTAAMVLAVTLLAAACSDGDRLTDRQRTDFLEGCRPAAGDAFCECALEQIEEVFTSEEFAEMGDAFPADGEVPADLTGAISPCLPLLEP